MKVMKKHAQGFYTLLSKHNVRLFLNEIKYVRYKSDLKWGKKNLINNNAKYVANAAKRLSAVRENGEEEKKIVVHEKYKVQVALCIDRFPLTFVQEKFEKDFEEFKDKWLLKTNNNLNINEEFLHMKYNLSSFQDKKKENNMERSYFDDEINKENKKNKNNKSLDHEESHEKNKEDASSENEDLENLFATEGIQNILNEKEIKKKKKNDRDMDEREKKNDYDYDLKNEYNYRNIKRKPTNFLYLIVKYKRTNKWMFPLIDFRKKFTIRQNLQYICTEHLKCEMPFFIGWCPCTFEKRKFKIPLSFNEIIGRKIFYYRAHYLNHDINLDLSKNEYINDFAWITRSELKDFLSMNKYQVIKDAIPLT
ncbi:hypothetical protein, conserved [Plasmodium gonderi]|uniref:Mitochondrial ribosomal protein L46 n=1 Tax=Plasmodium gonderi TaxID=77519 RepID=A0A1Y1JLR4_PLAGO|nr:hypothetical protein, conserved [Plasmodium gonderi]GAW81762.1 hypothetical protein, conserved [Plasmodium gonderi]